jgi:hypothetical protein
MRETFTEKVNHFYSDVAHVNVAFDVSARLFRLPRARDDFEDLMSRLSAAWKAGRPVEVVVERDEIVSVGSLENA